MDKIETSKRFKLNAIDADGFEVIIWGKSRNSVINKFDARYERRGHQIIIIDINLQRIDGKHYEPEIFRVGKDQSWMKNNFEFVNEILNKQMEKNRNEKVFWKKDGNN